MTDGKHIEIPPTAARSAAKEGVARYVLGIGLVLVIVAFAIIYLTVL